MSLLSAFTSAILPILIVMSVGYALARVLDPDVEGLNAVALYAFLPALIFHSLATTTLGGATLVRIFVAVGAFVFAMILVAEAAGRLLGVAEPFRSADVLASAFPNAGFYGIPLVEFTFGAVGRTTAVLYITAQSFLMYTVGVYIASRGGGTSGTAAVGEIFRLPLVYAIAAAVVVRALGVVPPESGTVMTTVAMVGNASIPLMLVIVGIQLAGLDRAIAPRVVVPTVLKLVVAPLVGLALAVGFANADVARVFVLLCATPVALIPLSLTISYSDDPDRSGITASEHLTTVIFVTTVASVITLTLLITLLQSGRLI